MKKQLQIEGNSSGKSLKDNRDAAETQISMIGTYKSIGNILPVLGHPILQFGAIG